MAIAKWIADLYPAAPGRYWETLHPDSLADHLIIRTAKSHTEIMRSLVAGASPSQTSQVLSRLARLTIDAPEVRAIAEDTAQRAFETSGREDSSPPRFQGEIGVRSPVTSAHIRSSGSYALRLQMVDVTGPSRWRWLLSDGETGALLADHDVDLVPAPGEVARFQDLYGYSRLYAAPDRRVSDESLIVERAGAWGGRDLLGKSVGSAIVATAAGGPVTVQVTATAPAERVLLWPLELSHVGGKPLAARGDVTFVYDIGGAGQQKEGVEQALRVLAVFSQPTQTSVLALRRERHALTQLIRRIAVRERATVEIQVVQYGVTRERLSQIADSDGGWDVLHLSGHGVGGLFALERSDGTPDLVDVRDLVALLRPARPRIKLAIVSTPQSALDATAETLRLLGLTDQAEAVEIRSGERAPSQVPGLARALVRELDCAVIAMRYPVTDEFAITFEDLLYGHLLSRRQPVDVAVARALAEAVGPVPSTARPAVSLAAPALLGTRAVGLRLEVPRGRPVLDPAEARMAYFPDEPERFVGRAEAMAKASAALSPESRQTAVLLHGMAGSGKTTCALELAYRHAENFAAAVFWQAPTREDEWQSALADFAIRLDIQLADYGFTIASHIGTAPALQAFLPRLRRAMGDTGVLLVLDNLETLLTMKGAWRDPRWGQLISALIDHDGESRLILTSRIAPDGLFRGRSAGYARVVTLPVHALSLEESVTLARELPNLRALLHTDGESVRPMAAISADRDRMRRVLRVVQGHPKLLELADAAAADRNRLDAQLTAAEEATAGHGLEAFFRYGASALDAEDFLSAMSTWTVTALAVLSPEAQLMAQFLACLEDDDRRSDVIEANWGDLWQRLERPGRSPEPGPLLQNLAAAALIEAKAIPAADAGDGRGLATYRVHPVVAAAITLAAGPQIREATDAELAAFWEAVANHAREREGEEDSGLVARAGLAAAPYLLRRGDWATAGSLLERATIRDGSPAMVQAALPTLRRIAAATGTPEASGVLARTLRSVDPGEAERLLRDALYAADSTGDNRGGSVVAGEMVSLLVDAGRLEEALHIAEQAASYTRRAGLGAWTQLGDQVRRLQVLGLMGQHDRVLAEVAGLRMRMAELSDSPTATETVAPWNVREVFLGTGYFSALAVRDWAQCLDLNAEITASKRRRGAGVYEIARTRFNDAGPLIELGRLAEAGRVLAECQQVYEDYADTTMLARVISARAGLEAALGHWQAAADFARAALRLSYARPELQDIAISHNNLANYLTTFSSDRAGRRAHRLAAALICKLAGMTHDFAEIVRSLAVELRQDGDTKNLPVTVAQVVGTAELTDGVRLGALLAALQPDPQAIEYALAEILKDATEIESSGF